MGGERCLSAIGQSLMRSERMAIEASEWRHVCGCCWMVMLGYQSKSKTKRRLEKVEEGIIGVSLRRYNLRAGLGM